MSEVAEILKRLQRENQEAREKFAGFQSRIFGAVLNGDDISEIVRDLTREARESGPESMEAGVTDIADRDTRAAGESANEPVESGVGEQSGETQVVGR